MGPFKFVLGTCRFGSATSALVNLSKPRERNAKSVERCDQAVRKCEAGRSDCFIATRARLNSFVAMHNATATAKSPKKFHILHPRHVWKSSRVDKRCSPAENSVIATSHPKQKPRVMRKA